LPEGQSGIARYVVPGPRGTPLDHPLVECLWVVVRDRDPVGVAHRGDIEMIVSRILVPGSEKGPRWSEPRVREQVEGGGAHRHPRVSEKCDDRHAETVPPRAGERTRRNAQCRYAVGMKERPGRSLRFRLRRLYKEPSLRYSYTCPLLDMHGSVAVN